MSRRTDRIRSLFATPHTEMLSTDNEAQTKRVSAGAVRSLQDTFSAVERENEALRSRLGSGPGVVEIDPSLIDPSPVTDRFEEPDDPSFERLKESMRQRGQEVPVLVRESAERDGRYQSAYGHRRVRAARELGLPVRAIVRVLSDADLVVAQGIENSAREDLSFIERAVFAMRLEDAGHDRSLVQEALSIDRAEASKLLSVARSVPHEIVEFIGRAPKVGRGRWLSLSGALSVAGAKQRARAAARSAANASLPSDARFMAVLTSLRATAEEPARSARQTLRARSGHAIATVERSKRELRVIIDRGTGDDFASYLVENLPELFERYAADRDPEDRRGA